MNASRNRLDAEDVRCELCAQGVIDEYAPETPRRGSEFRPVTCPRCREPSKRGSVAISASTGAWLHHGREREAGGACSGDIFDLVAAFEGLDCRRDWPRVL